MIAITTHTQRCALELVMRSNGNFFFILGVGMNHSFCVWQIYRTLEKYLTVSYKINQYTPNKDVMELVIKEETWNLFKETTISCTLDFSSVWFLFIY